MYILAKLDLHSWKTLVPVPIERPPVVCVVQKWYHMHHIGIFPHLLVQGSSIIKLLQYRYQWCRKYRYKSRPPQWFGLHGKLSMATLFKAWIVRSFLWLSVPFLRWHLWTASYLPWEWQKQYHADLLMAFESPSKTPYHEEQEQQQEQQHE